MKKKKKKKKKKISENFHFLQVMFSIYLNRRVLVMERIYNLVENAVPKLK